MSDLAEGLVKRGWDVSALTSDRICRDPKARIQPRSQVWRGVHIHRAPRPAFSQASNVGRLLNAFWLMANWLAFIAGRPAYDAVVLGSDPQFGYLMLPFIRLVRPKSLLFHWVFDLYPEAIAVNDMAVLSRLALLVRPLTRFCYFRLDGMVDIGPCMRSRLDGYGHGAARMTLVPWALTEPNAPLEPKADIRMTMFGDANLGVLYSGTIGKAHEFECFIALARELRRRRASVALCFAGRGNRYDELRGMVQDDDTNISFAGFVPESQLQERLGAGDIHMLSLRPGWEGIVVPSKFFGSLAAGKPVLYAGSAGSSIKSWIDQYDLGYVVNRENVSRIADELCRLSHNPALLVEKQQNAFRCYHEQFSKERIIDAWDQLLKQTLTRERIRTT